VPTIPLLRDLGGHQSVRPRKACICSSTTKPDLGLARPSVPLSLFLDGSSGDAQAGPASGQPPSFLGIGTLAGVSSRPGITTRGFSVMSWDTLRGECRGAVATTAELRCDREGHLSRRRRRQVSRLAQRRLPDRRRARQGTWGLWPVLPMRLRAGCGVPLFGHHAASSYSWSKPPSRSRRRTSRGDARMAGRGVGAASGARRPRQAAGGERSQPKTMQ
jgi:hypothetical protein